MSIKKHRTTDWDLGGWVAKDLMLVFSNPPPGEILRLANEATQVASSKQSKNSPLPGSTSKVPFSPITSAVLLGTNTKSLLLSFQSVNNKNIQPTQDFFFKKYSGNLNTATSSHEHKLAG